MECKPPAKVRPKGKTQTASARKRQKKASLDRKKERTIDIGVLKGEWTQLKTKLNLNSDEVFIFPQHKQNKVGNHKP